MSSSHEPAEAAAIPPSVAHLRQSLAELIAESQALRNDVHKAEAARKRVTTISLAVIAAMVVPLIILLVLVARTNSISQDTHATNELIADCINPTGKCAQEGSRRTGEAIGDIIRAEIYMAQCARMFPDVSGPAYDRRLEDCVYARLTEAARQRAAGNPTPQPTTTGSPR